MNVGGTGGDKSYNRKENKLAKERAGKLFLLIVI